MKKLAHVLGLSLVLVGAAMANTPATFEPGMTPANIVAGDREACWSEPPDLNGLIGSSEQILEFGLETELANDFTVNASMISKAIFWGGYYNNSAPCDPGIATPGFNLRFYEDAGCIPGSIIADVSATSFTEESIGCQQGLYPMFKWSVDVGVNVTAGGLYWFGAQLKDHTFPPQGGRLAAGAITGCDTVFKSAYFSYPDWTPAIDVFGVAFDASQEFECGATATEPSTWGRIKGLYR